MHCDGKAEVLGLWVICVALLRLKESNSHYAIAGGISLEPWNGYAAITILASISIPLPLLPRCPVDSILIPDGYYCIMAVSSDSAVFILFGGSTQLVTRGIIANFSS